MKPARGMPKSWQSLKRDSLAVWIAPAAAVVLFTYVWFVSAGLWSTWPKTAVYDYYDSLAAAFQNGQLHLQDHPSPELLALADPYRIGSRKNIEYIWDATLYQGRYYLYWGPLPAIMLVPLRLLGLQHVPDLYLAFSFVVGLFLILSRLLSRIWMRFFSELPPWTLSLAILVSGLAPPLAWMLNRPEVYEAALASGQFFLFVAIYLCFSVVDQAPRPALRLAASSVCLGFAIACRSSEALPAAFIVLVMALYILRHHHGPAVPGTPVKLLAANLAPVTVIIIALLWYNGARFGSILEFGYRYQLTLLQMPKHYGELLSVAYVPPNLYNYFLNPFTLAEDFPPVRPQYGIADFGALIPIPDIYFSEAITGLALTFPFMIFVAGYLLASPAPARSSPGLVADRFRQPLHWLRLLLLGVVAIELGQLLLFFFATERYLVQVVPSLSVAACIGCWCLILSARASHVRTRWISMAALILALCSVAISTLLAISSYQERIRTFNPGLIDSLNRWHQR